MTDLSKQDAGKLIISAAKSLKEYRLGDRKIAAFLYATSKAGNIGLFAASLRGGTSASIDQARFLAAEEGISFPDLVNELLPWLHSAGLFHLVRNQDGEIKEIRSLMLAYQDLLAAVSDYYESRDPTEEDRASLRILEYASEFPTPESHIRQLVALEFGEQIANTALMLTRSFRIVAVSGKGNDPLLFSPRVWAGLHANVERALNPLDNTQRSSLIELISSVRDGQGYPEILFRHQAEQIGIAHLVDMAVGVGLLNRTVLTMANGDSRGFLTTPHFYSDLEDEFGEDMCDRVKIFLDSIRNGQYLASPETGQILDPERLLRALLDYGEIGPATAIGTDYYIAEKAGIIRVRREPGRHMAHMELRQEDTVRKVLEVVSTGIVEPGVHAMTAAHVSEGTGFKSIEQSRTELGRLSPEMTELEFEIIRQLRE